MAYTIDDNCNGCSACEQQCPVQAIEGRFKVRYAIDPVLCIDCGVCGAICTEDAVFDQLGVKAVRVPRDQRKRPVVDVDLCNGCGLCVDICPFDCLVVRGTRYLGTVELRDPLQCVTCAECEQICIKGSITMGDVDLVSLLRSA